MRFGDLLQAALTSLWQRKFRSFLTVLGVLIGTTAVIVMISLGFGLTQAQLGSIENQRSLRQVTIHKGPQKVERGKKPPRMDDALLQELKLLPGVVRTWPVYELQGEAKLGGQAQFLMIQAVPAYALQYQGFDFAAGALPTGGSQLGLVLGSMVPDSMIDPFTGKSALGSGKEVIGKTLKVTFMSSDEGRTDPNGQGGQPLPQPKKVSAVVSGLLNGKPGVYTMDSVSIFADLDETVKALKKANPGKALPGQDTNSEGRPTGTFLYSRFVLETDSVEDAEALHKLTRELGYDAQADIEWIKQVQQQALLIQAVFGGIGAISLLVAAIGIANTMMMSVYERTKEIGVMKVLGARLGDIRKLFLLEAAGIGFFGGLLGTALSLLLSGLLNDALGPTLGNGMGGSATTISIIPGWLLLAGIGFATFIGTVAGLLPAQRAMRLSALEAIRNTG